MNEKPADDLLRKEFDQNYRRYLENVYLFSRINEILLNPDRCLEGSEARLSDVQLKKLGQQFLKTINSSSVDLGGATTTTTNRLSNESKCYLRERIGQQVDKELGEVNELLGSDEREDLDLVAVKLRLLMDSIDNLDGQKRASEAEYELKLDHCLKLSTEIMGLLKKLLAEFKLDFYSAKNSLECQHDLLEIELFFSKIEVTVHELTADLYSSEKLRALTVVRGHLDAEIEITSESTRRAVLELDQFKTLGKEFEALVAKYSSLKKDLEVKRMHLKRVKEDLNF